MHFDEIILENMKDLENRESENENLLSSKISESDKKNENRILPKEIKSIQDRNIKRSKFSIKSLFGLIPKIFFLLMTIFYIMYKIRQQNIYEIQQ